MRQIIAIAALLLGVAVAAAADAVRDPLPSATEPGYVSASDAVSDVRDLADDPSLPVTVVKYPPTDGSRSPADCYYELIAGGYRYYVGYRYSVIMRHPVDSADGQYFNNSARGVPKSAAEGRPVYLNEDQAQSLAYQYMADHFAELPQDMALHNTDKYDSPDNTSSEYGFVYYKNAGNGFLGPQRCFVDVDAEYGVVTGYGSFEFPLLVDTAAQLTPDQGIAAAMQALHCTADGVPTLLWAEVCPPDDLGNEELLYFLKLPSYTHENKDDSDTRFVTIDANTGAIVDEWEPAGLSEGDGQHLTPAQAAKIKRQAAAPHPCIIGKPIPMTIFGRKGALNRPAILVMSDPYIYLGYVVAAASGSAINGSGGLVTVASPRQTLTFRANISSFALDNRPNPLKHAPIYLAGAFYVPLELANIIAPGRFVYSPKSQTVDYRPTAL